MVAFAVLLSGCDRDECELGQARCRDNVAESCEYESSDSDVLVWYGEDCGQGVCMGGDTAEPFCALDDSRDSRCSLSPNQPVCDEQQQVWCHLGYATRITDCATSEGYCVEADEGAACVLEPTPSEYCGDMSYDSTCAGNAILFCYYGYARSREPCPAGEHCVVTPGYATCSAAAELDPLCPPMAPLARVCDGNTIVDCTYGYRDIVFPCAAGEICEMAGTPEFPEAFCVPGE